MSNEISVFLMFSGRAEDAMNFYISLFEQSEVLSIVRYGPGEDGKEGTVMHAAFTLGGRPFMAIDSSFEHGFTFTPAMSLYVNCESAAEVERLFIALGEGGQVMMPLGSYPFSEKFGWVQDKFGVSWQLNLLKKK